MEKRHKKQGGGWRRRMRRKEAEKLLLKPTSWKRGPLVEREIMFNRFRETLGEERLASFISYLRTNQETDSCTKLDRELSDGKSLLSLVLTGDPYRGYYFNFRKYSRDRWALFFGYTIPLADDWGVWSVVFDSCGKIARIRLWRNYIS